MPRYLQPVSPGQPWQGPSAVAHNTLVELAARASRPGGAPAAGNPWPHCLWQIVKNDSSNDWDRGQPVRLREPVVTATDSPAFCHDFSEFISEQIWNYTTQTNVNPINLAVTLEPIPVGRTGAVAFGGSCWALVTVVEEADNFCFATEAATRLRTTRNHGAASARILWKEPGTGDKLAWITFAPEGMREFAIAEWYGTASCTAAAGIASNIAIPCTALNNFGTSHTYDTELHLVGTGVYRIHWFLNFTPWSVPAQTNTSATEAGAIGNSIVTAVNGTFSLVAESGFTTDSIWGGRTCEINHSTFYHVASPSSGVWRGYRGVNSFPAAQRSGVLMARFADSGGSSSRKQKLTLSFDVSHAVSSDIAGSVNFATTVSGYAVIETLRGYATAST